MIYFERLNTKHCYRCYNITGFQNSMSEHNIKVVVAGLCSDTALINAGVPQGSVLSPILFILHINYMFKTSYILCYAHDSTSDAHYIIKGCINMPRQ